METVIVDLASGTEQRRPLTGEEQAQRDADAQAAADARAREDQRTQARAQATQRLKTASTIADLRSALVTLLNVE